jgi:hypothetical protein
MDRKSSIDKLPEGTANPTRKSGKSGPRSWEIEQYRYQEPTDNNRSLHSDPRLEMQRLQLDEHDNNFIPSDDDGDHGHGSSVFIATPNLDACDPSASDQGTLAGGAFISRLANKLTDRLTNWQRQHRRTADNVRRQARSVKWEIDRIQRRTQ